MVSKARDAIAPPAAGGRPGQGADPLRARGASAALPQQPPTRAGGDHPVNDAVPDDSPVVDAAAEVSGGPQAPRVVRLGFGPHYYVPYAAAWAEQRRVHEQVVQSGPDGRGTVLLLEHAPVYTAGRRTEDWERPVDGSPVVDVDRGGRITWHGPGQLVGYPILRLPEPVDVVAYVRDLEAMLIEVCAEVGLVTTRVAGRSGVWVPGSDPDGAAAGPDRKVAAVGVRVARGVTMHGFALNCDCDLSWFSRIVACGLGDASVTSVSRELGHRVSVQDVLPLVEGRLGSLARHRLRT